MSVQYWSDYWKHGHLTSFAQDIEDNYSGEIAEFWRRTFSNFNQRGKVIVDVGTGNGALIDLAVIKFKFNQAQYIGVDSAKLSVPQHLATQDNIKFLDQSQAEALPFKDETVDLYVSQFGIEYSDLSRSLKEAHRVLKPKGQLSLVVHDSESTIVKPNLQISNGVKQIMATDGVYSQLLALVNALAKYGKNHVLSEEKRVRLNKCLQELSVSNKHGLYGSGFPDMLKSTMQAVGNVTLQKENLKQFKKEMKSLSERLNDLHSAALNDEKKAWLINTTTELGFINISSGPLKVERTGLVGFHFTATKD